MYFADGMTDELLTELGQINSLRVISRTSVMRYKGVHKPLPEIARELNVDGIVEGTVLKQGDEVRVTAQLVYAPSDRHLWAQSYRGDLRQMLALQSDVANAIATQIRLELRPHERVAVSKDRVLNPKAYESYLRGRLLLNRRTPASLQEAIHLFRAAAAEDPDYGAPLAAMAGSYLLLQQYGAKSSAETLPYAAQAAQQALQLDAMLSGAHAALAVIHSDYEWDWKKAKSEFKRSIDANPNDATAHQWYAEFLAAQGRTADAAAEIQLAQGLDPLSPIIDVVSGEIAFFARDYDRTIAVCRKALAKDSGFAPAYSFIGLAYTQKGDYAAAAEHLKKAVALSHESPMSTSFLGAVYALSGRRQDAESIRVRLVQESARRYVSPVDLAILDIELGARGRAVADIGRAGTAHDHWVTFIKVDPRLDGIRAETGFATLVRHLGLS
jgi:TolB-like protein/Flp pilus assembly protein TadD